jgi:hypothetical protein
MLPTLLIRLMMPAVRRLLQLPPMLQHPQCRLPMTQLGQMR